MVATGLRNSERGGPPLVRGRLLRLSLALPAVAMVVSLAALTLYCRSLLSDAAAGHGVVVGGMSFWLIVGGFFAACALVVLVQSVRLAGRVAGPELRLCRALQRIRSGDVAFRVSLRRGDLLGGLARECNDLLDWLNEHRPATGCTGSDVVEVAPLPAERSEP